MSSEPQRKIIVPIHWNASKSGMDGGHCRLWRAPMGRPPVWLVQRSSRERRFSLRGLTHFGGYGDFSSRHPHRQLLFHRDPPDGTSHCRRTHCRPPGHGIRECCRGCESRTRGEHNGRLLRVDGRRGDSPRSLFPPIRRTSGCWMELDDFWPVIPNHRQIVMGTLDWSPRH